jgi:hypothetical protein
MAPTLQHIIAPRISAASCATERNTDSRPPRTLDETLDT